MCRPRVSASILREFERGTGNHNNERPIHPTDRQLRGKCAYFMVMHVALLHLFLSQKRHLVPVFWIAMLVLTHSSLARLVGSISYLFMPSSGLRRELMIRLLMVFCVSQFDAFHHHAYPAVTYTCNRRKSSSRAWPTARPSSASPSGPTTTSSSTRRRDRST